MPSRKDPPVPTGSNPVQEKFICQILRRGKKTVARKIFEDTLKIIAERSKGGDPYKVFEQALSNATPLIEVKPKRVGGGVYQVPREVMPKRQFTLACRWILVSARSVKGKRMAEKLANEILLAADKQGGAVKKKEDVHKMAEANRAFAFMAKY